MPAAPGAKAPCRRRRWPARRPGPAARKSAHRRPRSRSRRHWRRPAKRGHGVRWRHAGITVSQAQPHNPDWWPARRRSPSACQTVGMGSKKFSAHRRQPASMTITAAGRMTPSAKIQRPGSLVAGRGRWRSFGRALQDRLEANALLFGFQIAHGHPSRETQCLDGKHGQFEASAGAAVSPIVRQCADEIKDILRTNGGFVRDCPGWGTRPITSRRRRRP